MSITNTVLIFVVAPFAIVVVVAALSYVGGGDGRKAKRYRPGRPYDFTPIWFLSAPEQLTSGDPVMQPQGSSAVAGSGQRAAIEPVEAKAPAVRAPQGATGGASDRW